MKSKTFATFGFYDNVQKNQQPIVKSRFYGLHKHITSQEISKLMKSTNGLIRKRLNYRNNVS